MKFKLALSEETLVHLIAALTAVMGIVNVLSAVTPSMKDRLQILETVLPFGISTGGHLTSALAGFALLMLSVSLWRRKQLAWMARKATEIARYQPSAGQGVAARK